MFRHLEPTVDPVLIVGNQKSGTSAIAALLALATGSSVAIDLIGELIKPTTPAVMSGDLSLDAFLKHNDVDFAKKVVKDCHMTFIVEEVMRRLPDPQTIFVVRDPRANVRSILNRVGLGGDSSTIPSDVWGSLGPGWRLVLDGTWLNIEGDLITQLAERWNRIADVYLHRTLPMSLVRYEDFSQDKPGVIKSLARAVGLEVVADVEPQMDRQFQPAGDREVSWLEFFGANNLARIEELCGPRMAQFGYE